MQKIPTKISLSIALVAMLIVAAGAVLLYRGYVVETRDLRDAWALRGESMLDSLAAGIRAQCRMGMGNPERFTMTFQEMAQTPAVVGILLRSGRDNVLGAGGDTAHLAEAQAGTRAWLADRVIIAIDRDLKLLECGMQGGRGWNGGRGPGGAQLRESHGDGPYTMVIALDTTEPQAQMLRAREHYAGMGVGLVLVVLFGAIAAHMLLGKRAVEKALVAEQERTAYLGKMAQIGAGLAHETKNPLSIVRGLAQSICALPSAPVDVRDMASRIVDQSDATVGQINAFLTLARPKEPTLADVNLDDLCGELATLFSPEATQKGARVECATGAVRVLADEGLLRRAVTNVLVNALQAVGDDGVVRLCAEARDGVATLSVSDNGIGIEAADLPHVTEPYFTRSHNGTGLGLAIVDQIARAHGWTLTIDSQPGHGCTVSFQGLARVR